MTGGRGARPIEKRGADGLRRGRVRQRPHVRRRVQKQVPKRKRGRSGRIVIVAVAAEEESERRQHSSANCDLDDRWRQQLPKKESRLQGAEDSLVVVLVKLELSPGTLELRCRPQHTRDCR